jgi:hypothetical protein
MDDEDRPYDASEPKDVKARIKESQRWDDRRSRVIVGIMSCEDGRRWIRETLELAHVGLNPFNTDALKMAFNCGEANVGQRIMAEVMNATPQMYMQMMAEANPKAEIQKDETNG